MDGACPFTRWLLQERGAGPAETPRPVKTVVVEAPDIGGVRRFPGRIDALNKAEVAFRVPGTIAELPVKEGDLVEQGQLLVALDPTDFEIAVKDAQASFDRAENDFKRAQELVEKDFISRTDFDEKEAQFKSAQAALEQAKQDLSYTRLTASFPATVAKRYVQRFEEVQAKQPVLALQDSTQLEVRIDVPENIMLSIRPPGSGQPEAGRVPVTASFDNRPGREFDLTLREVATRADPKTQTFEVSFTMPAPKDFLVLPGMTATVTADLSKVATANTVFYLPAAAVTADESLQPFVWVVDETEMTVHRDAGGGRSLGGPVDRGHGRPHPRQPGGDRRCRLPRRGHAGAPAARARGGRAAARRAAERIAGSRLGPARILIGDSLES